MKVNVKFDYNKMSQRIISEQLATLGYKFSYVGNGEIDFLEKISTQNIDEISAVFEPFGIEIIE